MPSDVKAQSFGMVDGGADRCCGRIVVGVDGSQIREVVRAVADDGYTAVAPGSADRVLPSILEAVNEIAAAATAEVADQAGYAEGARLATSRRAMLAAVAVVAQALEDDLPGRVKDLRDEGVTWREIARLLDMTPEGVQRRFDPVAGEKAREANRRARQRRQDPAGPDTAGKPQRPARKPRSTGNA